jgi:spore maturation protein CgeB
MKILFLGDVNPGWVNTTQMRLQVMRELGHDVIPICIRSYERRGGRYGGAVFRKLLCGPTLWRYNRDVAQVARELRPDVLWAEKARWLLPETLLKVKRACGAKLVHYTVDPALSFHKSRHFVKAIPYYDLMISNKRYERDLYCQAGVQQLALINSAFDEQQHAPVKLTSKDRQRHHSDAIFIGSYARGRERYLCPIAQAEMDLALWGSGWLDRCPNADLRQHARGGTVTGQEYAKALCGSKIGLGLLSPLVPDRETTRSVEIPATGSFLLAERTEEHGELFEERTEAEFFDCEEELIEKTRFYLSHSRERLRIAKAGRERCLRSGYSYQEQMKKLLQRVEKLGVNAKCNLPRKTRWRLAS